MSYYDRVQFATEAEVELGHSGRLHIRRISVSTADSGWVRMDVDAIGQNRRGTRCDKVIIAMDPAGAMKLTVALAKASHAGNSIAASDLLSLIEARSTDEDDHG